MIRYILMAIVMGAVFLFVFLNIRYGPVHHTWIKLDKSQLRQLKDMNRKFRQSHPPTRQAGSPLYRRKILSHEGIGVYKNGIYAKFCIGPWGRYRFVPFEGISAIHPVTVENPYTKTDSKWLGLSSWKALHIETERGMVHLVNSRAHEFETLVPALKKAMGDKWDALYHPDEVLWTNLLKGEAGIHSSVRRGPFVERPSRPFVEVEPKVLPSTTGKGELLLEESDSDLDKKMRTIKKMAVVFLAVALPLVAIGLYVILMRTLLFSSFLGTMLLILGIVFLILAVMLFAAVKSSPRIMIYENGFESPLLVGQRTMFISFGEVTNVNERKSALVGDHWVFETGKPNQMATIMKDMEGFDEIFDIIKSRINRPEYVVELEPTEEEAVSSRKLEYGLYATGFVIGVALSIGFAAFVYAGSPPYYFYFGLGLILPPVTMITLAILTLQMRKFRKMVPRKLNVKIPAIIVVALIIYSVLNLTVGVQLGSGAPIAPENIGPKPATSVLTPGLHENTNITADGHILVEAGDYLWLRNVNLTMDLSHDKEFGIWVEEGAELIMEDTTIRSATSPFGYTFEIMGTARITGCHISSLWGDPENENFDGGLEIFSSDVVIEHTTIIDSATNGLLIVNSAPLLENITVKNARDDGIEMLKSKPRVYNSTIEGCGWAMMVSQYSTPTIKWNSIAHNNHGICVQTSDPVIVENDFTNNRNYAIRVGEYSNPTISDNTFNGNDNEILEEPGMSILGLCGVAHMGVAVVSLLILFWVYKEGMRKEY